jgi:hypothetical protein
MGDPGEARDDANASFGTSPDGRTDTDTIPHRLKPMLQNEFLWSQAGDELVGKDFGFFGEGFGADPIAGLQGFAGTLGEAADFGSEVLLHGV